MVVNYACRVEFRSGLYIGLLFSNLTRTVALMTSNNSMFCAWYIRYVCFKIRYQNVVLFDVRSMQHTQSRIITSLIKGQALNHISQKYWRKCHLSFLPWFRNHQKHAWQLNK